MIHTYSSTIRRKEMEAVLTCMVDEKIGPGELNERLIQTVKETTGCDGAVALRSPSLALEYALKACDIAKDSGIMISALAPSWVIHAVEKYGCKPIVLDVAEDTGNITVENALATLTKNVVSSLSGSFVGGAEVYNYINSMITGDTYYGTSEVTMSAMSDLAKASQSFMKDMGAVLEGEKDMAAMRYSFDKFISQTANVLGVPYNNIANMVEMVAKPALQATYGEYMGEYYYLLMIENPNSTYYRKDYYKVLYKAYKGDQMTYGRMKKMQKH